MTYNTIKNFVETNNHSGIYQNDSGELVSIRYKSDEDGNRFKILTYQNNGWTRINIYWQNGTIEEYYHKENNEHIY